MKLNKQLEKKKEKHKRSKISRSVQLFCFVSLFVCFSLCVDGLAERQKLHPDGSRESAPQFCGYHIKYSSGKGSLSLSLSLSLPPRSHFQQGSTHTGTFPELGAQLPQEVILPS